MSDHSGGAEILAWTHDRQARFRPWRARQARPRRWRWFRSGHV